MKFSHRFRFFTGLLTLSLMGSLCFNPGFRRSCEKSLEKDGRADRRGEGCRRADRGRAPLLIIRISIPTPSTAGPRARRFTRNPPSCMEASSGAILYNKDMDMKNYPASITKIMTALLTLENCSLDETVTYSYNATHTIDAGSSSIYTTEDEQLTVEQSLYALMLESANECANGLAEHVAGSIDAFAEMMNQKAAELGCTNTHFANANGLHNDEHYTSAHDMALITGPPFRTRIFSVLRHGPSTEQPTNKA